MIHAFYANGELTEKPTVKDSLTVECDSTRSWIRRYHLAASLALRQQRRRKFAPTTEESSAVGTNTEPVLLEQ